MKATGIVRRIDDLGRVVVPKEIRRTLRIREGDPLEIFTDREGEIILKKYSPIGELGTFAQQYADSLEKESARSWKRLFRTAKWYRLLLVRRTLFPLLRTGRKKQEHRRWFLLSVRVML